MLSGLRVTVVLMHKTFAKRLSEDRVGKLYIL